MTIKQLQNELSVIIIENILPDVEKYKSCSYHISLVEYAIVRPYDVLMSFMKFDDGNNISWQYYRTYYTFKDGYNENLYREILENQIRIYKSIYI